MSVELIERLRALPPDSRARAVAKLAQRGLLAALDVPPERLEPPSDALTCKQRALWELDHDGSHGHFYECAALWFAPSVPAQALMEAYGAVAGEFDALCRVVEGTGGSGRTDTVPGTGNNVSQAPDRCLRSVRVPVAEPSLIKAPSADWVRDVVSKASRGWVDPSLTSADVGVYELADGSSALAVLGHDLHLDHQGLVQILGPAIEARLTGSDPVVEDVRITDVAAWQQQRLSDGVLGAAVAARREALRSAPACPWPTAGDRSGSRIEILDGRRAWERLRDIASSQGVSLASLTLAAWYRALTAWDPRTTVTPIGCCTTARMRPELRTTLGNLTNTVVVVPGSSWSASADLMGEAHQAMIEALGSVDLPFELVFGDGPVQDEQVGIRFTFVEDLPSSGDTLLRSEEVPVDYAKSVLSCEVHVSGESLHVWLDYRSALFTPRESGQLAELLRQELADPPER